jgi:hypothetical protein
MPALSYFVAQLPKGVVEAMPQHEQMKIDSLVETIAFFRRSQRAERVALAVLSEPILTGAELEQLAAVGVQSIWFLGDAVPKGERLGPVRCLKPADIPAAVKDADLLVAYDPRYWDVYQKIGVSVPIRNAVLAKDLPVVPYAANAWRYPMLPVEFLNGGNLDQIRLDDTIYQYISRSNLRGSFAEFGTYFGRSFYKAYLLMNQQLDGKFWAFDSFGGLPPTKAQEAEFTKGDFTEGRYFCNEGSFRSIGRMLFPDDKNINDRIKVAKGYYSESLDGHTIADYGIPEQSISYCSIDCDLFDATLSVLRFIAPALQNGAVMYLDDYRMARAAKEASLYHAVKVWLGENPSYELIDLHRDHWQHQYVIFNRY